MLTMFPNCRPHARQPETGFGEVRQQWFKEMISALAINFARKTRIHDSVLSLVRLYQNPRFRALVPALKTLPLRPPESRTDAMPELIVFDHSTMREAVPQGTTAIRECVKEMPSYCWIFWTARWCDATLSEARP
jgi:hypothetical protein